MNVGVLFCADAVHRLSERGGPAADWGGGLATPGGGERTEHPEGGHAHVQRRRTVRRRDRLLFPSLPHPHFPFLLCLTCKHATCFPPVCLYCSVTKGGILNLTICYCSFLISFSPLVSPKHNFLLPFAPYSSHDLSISFWSYSVSRADSQGSISPPSISKPASKTPPKKGNVIHHHHPPPPVGFESLSCFLCKLLPHKKRTRRSYLYFSSCFRE